MVAGQDLIINFDGTADVGIVGTGDGVFIDFTTEDFTFIAEDGPDINSGTGAGNDGIDASTTTGNIIIHNAREIYANDDGLDFSTEGGNIYVDQSGDIITGVPGGAVPTSPVGIYAYVTGGAGTIDVNMYADIFSRGSGIYSRTTGTGAITIDAVNIEAEAGDGVNASTVNGDLTITTTGLVHSTGAGYGAVGAGIIGVTGGDYNNLTIDALNIDSDVQSGIYAHTTGEQSNIDIEVGGYVSANQDGIYAVTDGETADIYIDVLGNITATNAAGVDAHTSFGGYGSEIEIDINGTITAGTDGITTSTAGTTSAGIDIEAQAITASGFGVYAHTVGADAQTGINIDTYALVTSTNSTGIRAFTEGNDANVVINTNAIQANADGVYARANEADVTVTTGGRVVANGGAGSSAVVVENGEDVTVNINAYAMGTGAGVLINYAQDSIDINVGVNGYLTAGGNRLAIDTSNAPADTDINIFGTVYGYMTLDAEDDVYVQQGGLWRPTLTSDFGDDDDRVFNDGTVRTVSLTPGGTEDVYLENLEEFFNGASVIGKYNETGGLITMVNDLEGDTFHLNGNTAPMDFFGGVGSQLAVDAFLAEGEEADKLFINGEVKYGSTDVLVNNVNEIGSSPDLGDGVYGDGIAVVVISGATDESDFNLIDGPIEAGFFAWDMFLDTADGRYGGDNVHELRTIGLSSAAHAMPIAVTAAQDIWHETTGVWLDRQADLRMQLNSGMAMSTADLPMEEPVVVETLPGASVTPGVWAKGVGVWAERDAEATIEGPPEVTFDLSSDQRTYGFIGGFDFGREGASGDSAFLVGLMGGYLWSKLDFDEAVTDFDFEGPTAGVYATFLSNGFYLDALVKADFLDLEIDGDALAPGDDDESSDVLNLGARVDAGYQFHFGSGFFLEPQATLAYVNSDFDDVDIFGGTVEFEDGESFRGRLGARIGGVFQTANYAISPDLTVSVWQEFSGDNEATITGFVGPAGFFDVEDESDDTFGEVSVGLSATGQNGWSGFLKGDYTFSDDYNSAAVNGGVRYNW
jgi:hypothetical protein